MVHFSRIFISTSSLEIFDYVPTKCHLEIFRRMPLVQGAAFQHCAVSNSSWTKLESITVIWNLWHDLCSVPLDVRENFWNHGIQGGVAPVLPSVHAINNLTSWWLDSKICKLEAQLFSLPFAIALSWLDSLLEDFNETWLRLTNFSFICS